LVAVTGYGEEADRRQSAQAGFDRHLIKPVGQSELRSLLSDALGRNAV
jgi:CheY-like chemotaxis protein